MYLGLYTECLGSFSLDEMLDHASRLGLNALKLPQEIGHVPLTLI